MTRHSLSDSDRDQLARHGIPEEEALRQLALLADPPPPPELVAPSTAEDGITRLPAGRHDELVARFDEARLAGRVSKLVPASGAASRMFRTLTPWIEYAGNPVAAAQEMSRRAVAGDPDAGDPIRFLSELPRFPFYDELARAVADAGQELERLRTGGDAGAVLHVLLSPDRLGYEARPKALIPFHRYDSEVRTPVEEHLAEAAGYAADESGLARLHFTVPPHAEEAVGRLLDRVRARYRERHGVRFEVTFSVQDPATDTLAVGRNRGAGEASGDPSGGEIEPFRLDDGSLLLRPGGHGALLGNLDGIARRGGDLVLIKNIDNVQPDRVKPEVILWKKLLGGYLLELQEQIVEHLEILAGRPSGDDLDRIERFLADRLSVRVPRSWGDLGDTERGDRAERLRDRLDRPLRVAGMVVNRGEPGGGPFWVRSPDGTVSAQIVERAQIDEDDPGQVEIFGSSTHFNPVDLACAVRDPRGEPYELRRFVDERAVFIAEKTHQGRPLLALERPGLWNGAMAKWNTAFVEVPEVTFSPVKTVFDLLRREHQTA